jgi:hypothetical protein
LIEVQPCLLNRTLPAALEGQGGRVQGDDGIGERLGADGARRARRHVDLPRRRVDAGRRPDAAADLAGGHDVERMHDLVGGQIDLQQLALDQGQSPKLATPM